MATPISNDKILPSDNARTPVSGKGTAETSGRERSDANASTAVSSQANEVDTGSVDVERAHQIYNQAEPNISTREDAISTSEQAHIMAADISDQIERNGMQALQAQARSASPNLSALLEAAPA